MGLLLLLSMDGLCVVIEFISYQDDFKWQLPRRRSTALMEPKKEWRKRGPRKQMSKWISLNTKEGTNSLNTQRAYKLN